MKDYVQVPAAELEKAYEFTARRESTAFLYLSRFSGFILHVLVMFISILLFLFVINIATVILTLYCLLLHKNLSK